MRQKGSKVDSHTETYIPPPIFPKKILNAVFPQKNSKDTRHGIHQKQGSPLPRYCHHVVGLYINMYVLTYQWLHTYINIACLSTLSIVYREHTPF